MDDLKPCPLCSGTPWLRDFAGWEIHCKCGLTYCIESPEKADVIAAWNNRPQLSAQSVSAVQPVAWMWEYHGKRVTLDKAEADAIAADVPVMALVHQRAADADAVDAKRYRWLKSQAKVEDRDGGWNGFYSFPHVKKYDGSTYGGAKPFDHLTVDCAIDAAMNHQEVEVKRGC